MPSAAINEAVNLLSEISPRELALLRESHPALVGELLPGLTMGETDGLVKERALVMHAALKSGSAACDSDLKITRKRISQARGLRAMGQVCATVGSGSTLAALHFFPEGAVPIIAASLTLFASLVPIGAQFLTGARTRGRTLDEIHIRIADLRFQMTYLADELKVRLSIWTSAFEQEVVGLIRKGNGVCEEFNRLRAESLLV
jgi:hypothetical protein